MQHAGNMWPQHGWPQGGRGNEKSYKIKNNNKTTLSKNNNKNKQKKLFEEKSYVSTDH